MTVSVRRGGGIGTLSFPDPRARQPLGCVRLLAFCQVGARPSCGVLLADIGPGWAQAEPLEADQPRSGPPLDDSCGKSFASLNRRDRSLASDLRNPEGRQPARRLVQQAGMRVDDRRPGSVRR